MLHELLPQTLLRLNNSLEQRQRNLELALAI
jgi:hypothetical protein